MARPQSSFYANVNEVFTFRAEYDARASFLSVTATSDQRGTVATTGLAFGDGLSFQFDRIGVAADGKDAPFDPLLPRTWAFVDAIRLATWTT